VGTNVSDSGRRRSLWGIERVGGSCGVLGVVIVEPDRTMLKSAYEVAREARILANFEALREIGVDVDQQEHGQDQRQKDSRNKSKNKRRKRAPVLNDFGQRKSRRLQGQVPDEIPSQESAARKTEKIVALPPSQNLLNMEKKIERLRDLHEKESTGYKNPTATYEHTWMRVRTMTDKKLEQRIKVIENARGLHCKFKMRMFAEVLILANKSYLAKKAEEALKRLENLV